MDFVQEHLKTEKKINFGDSQERSNNIEIEILADTVYVKVRHKTKQTNIKEQVQQQQLLQHQLQNKNKQTISTMEYASLLKLGDNYCGRPMLFC